jgi:predicted transcriptional regulator
MNKTAKQLERYFKGVANHRRIKILLLLKDNDQLTLIEIADYLHGNIKTISEHVNKLVKAGLVNKKQAGVYVFHSLSPYGEVMIDSFTRFK